MSKRKRVSTGQSLTTSYTSKRLCVPSPTSWIGNPVRSQEDITPHHLLWTYGLLPESGALLCAIKHAARAPAAKSPSPEKAKADEADSDALSIGEDDSVVAAGRKCTKKGCKGNPHCLNWMGVEEWDAKDAMSKFQTHFKLGRSPVENMRDDELPVGLKNLGATCYANAALQSWFNTLPFRSGVYSCLPSPPPGKTSEETFIYALQTIFAAMQEGLTAVVDPERLVDILKLQKGEQQDAQEFSKLFLDLIAKEFKKQQDPELRTLIDDLFGGKMSYATRCKRCKTVSSRREPFLELELNLSPTCTLQEAIERLLEREVLDGDNKYSCAHCDSLQPAERYLELDQLPPFLHFSLLRFVFDMQTLSRKKSKASIRFPQTIDMAPFLPDAERAKLGGRPLVYELRSVLLHQGASAYSGHYVCHAWDPLKNKWFKMDDEYVETYDPWKKEKKTPASTKAKVKMSAKGKAGRGSVMAVVSEDETPTPSKSQTTASKKTKGKGKAKETIDLASDSDSFDTFIPPPLKSKKKTLQAETDDEDESRTISSKDAYLLLYARRDTDTTTPSSRPAPVPNGGGSSSSKPSPSRASASPSAPTKYDLTPPPAVGAEVERLAAAHNDACADFDKREKELVERFERLREEKKGVWREWAVRDFEEESYLVSRKALEGWVGEELVDPKKFKAKKDKEKKETDKKEKDTSMSTSPGLNSRAGTASQSATPAPPTGPAEEEHENEHEQDVKPSDDAVEDPGPAEEPRDRVLSNADVLCPHGKASPARTGEMKRISKTAHDRIVEMRYRFQPDLSTSEGLCRECVEGIFHDKLYENEHAEHVERFKEIQSDLGEDMDDWLISKAWLQDWKRATPKMHTPHTIVDPPPNSDEYSSDVYCQHGGRTLENIRHVEISTTAYTYLRGIFPDWESLSAATDPCELCREHDARQKVDRAEDKQRADKERTKFGRPLLQQLDIKNRVLYDDIPAALLNEDFVLAWKAYALDPYGVERPSMCDNTIFLCEHNKLIVDPARAADLKNKANRIVVVPQQIFENIKTEYLVQPEIVVTRFTSFSQESSARAGIDCGSYEVCDDCRHARQSAFDECKVLVSLLDPIDPPPTSPAHANGRAKGRESGAGRTSPVADGGADSEVEIVDGPATSTKRKKIPQTYSKGSRKSKRIRTTKESKRKTVQLVVTKADTVKDIKMKIDEELDVPTIYQRLFLNGRELEDNSATVDSLGVLPLDTFEVLPLEPPEDEAAFGSDVEVDDEGHPKRGGGEGSAFRGSLLHDYEAAIAASLQDSDSPERGRSSSNPAPPSNGADADANGEEVACASCTYLNNPARTICEMCQSPLR